VQITRKNGLYSLQRSSPGRRYFLPTAAILLRSAGDIVALPEAEGFFSPAGRRVFRAAVVGRRVVAAVPRIFGHPAVRAAPADTAGDRFAGRGSAIPQTPLLLPILRFAT